jgi:UDP-GlcNAc:undecaprenyl-phosphate GlcNAc-1-phosphate transferase
MLLSYALLAMVTLGVCLAARPIGHMLRVLDVPCRNGRKKHRRVTPLVGGMAIMLPFIILGSVETALFQTPLYFGLLILSVAFLGMGFLDDRGHLAPSLRLTIAGVTCLGVVIVVPDLRLAELDFAFGSTATVPVWLSCAFAVLCLVALQNAVNMADGKNGLVIGLSLIWVGALAAYAPSQLTPILVVLAVGLCITLVFNLRSKLFLGDAGSYALSVVIGALTIYAYNTHAGAFGTRSLTADGVALWFLVPVLDCARLIVSRVLQGKSPFSPDRNHLHHLLSQRLSSQKALICYFVLVGAPIALSIAVRAVAPVLVIAEAATYWIVVYKLTQRTEPAEILAFQRAPLGARLSRPVSAMTGAVLFRKPEGSLMPSRTHVSEALSGHRAGSDSSSHMPLSNVG